MARRSAVFASALGATIGCYATAAMPATGSISGIFQNPEPTQDLIVSGVGTSSVSTGDPADGSVQTFLGFTGLSFNVPQGQPFVAGLLTYTNGMIECCSFDAIDIIMNSSSGDPQFVQTLTESLTFELTLNLDTNTAEQNADVVFFESRPDFGGFRVLEDATGTVQVLAEFNSLDLVGFGDVLTPSTAFLTEDPFAPVPDGFTVAVPLPATIWLFLSVVPLALSGRLKRLRAERAGPAVPQA